MALKLARTALALGAAVSLTAASLPALAQNVAVVNGTPVPVSRADAMVREMVRQGQPNSPQLQQQVRESWSSAKFSRRPPSARDWPRSQMSRRSSSWPNKAYSSAP